MPLFSTHIAKNPNSRMVNTTDYGEIGRRPMNPTSTRLRGASPSSPFSLSRMDYPGLETVLEEMKRLVLQYKGNPTVRDKAVEITSVIPVDARTNLPNRRAFNNIANAVYDWMKKHIQYVRDPDGIEWLQTPLITLKNKYGDCDDQSILAGALLSSIGVPTRFKVVKADPRKPNAFSHVYLEYQANGQWKPFDPTLHTKAGDGLSDNQIFESKIVPLSDVPVRTRLIASPRAAISWLAIAAILGYGYYHFNYKIN